jgi:hypothetical protein
MYIISNFIYIYIYIYLPINSSTASGPSARAGSQGHWHAQLFNLFSVRLHSVTMFEYNFLLFSQLYDEKNYNILCI